MVRLRIDENRGIIVVCDTTVGGCRRLLLVHMAAIVVYINAAALGCRIKGERVVGVSAVMDGA